MMISYKKTHPAGDKGDETTPGVLHIVLFGPPNIGIAAAYLDTSHKHHGWLA